MRGGSGEPTTREVVQGTRFSIPKGLGCVWDSTQPAFFFSSRRRHTMWPRDWSSDVCSSDLAAAAHTVADTLQLAGIICYTATGSTALRVARERPGLAVIGLSPVVATGRKLALVWGVHCVLTSDPENLAAMVRKACRIAFDEGFAGAGEGVIIVAGVPLGSPGTTNMVRIAYLDD